MSIMKGGEQMPRLDGTGPQGLGANTGRGMGRCNNIELTTQNPQTTGNDFRRLFTRQGNCRRNRFFNQNSNYVGTKEEEKEWIKNQIKGLENQLAQLKEKITNFDV